MTNEERQLLEDTARNLLLLLKKWDDTIAGLSISIAELYRAAVTTPERKLVTIARLEHTDRSDEAEGRKRTVSRKPSCRAGNVVWSCNAPNQSKITPASSRRSLRPHGDDRKVAIVNNSLESEEQGSSVSRGSQRFLI